MDFDVTREEALELLIKNWSFKVETEAITIQQAIDRVTAYNVYSKNTLPICRSSQADGIAVRSQDFINGLPNTSNWKKGIEFVQADTGDDFPDEYDTIIPVEKIYYNEAGQLCFTEDFEFSQGNYVSPKGSMITKGELLISANVRLTPAHLAILATGGIHQIEVIKKPRVVYIPTGSELIPPGIKPERGQNIEANGLMVSSFLQQWGADPVCYPIIKDKPEELEAALDMALENADIILINGGSSKGEEDFNTNLLQKRASFFKHGVKAAPGRPIGMAIINGKPVINIPGPVIATFIAMDWCVRGLVHHYLNISIPIRAKIKAKLGKNLKKMPGYEFYYRLVLSKQEDGSLIAATMERGNTLPNTLLNVDALFIAPIGIAEFNEGEEIEAELLWGLENL